MPMGVLWCPTIALLTNAHQTSADQFVAAAAYVPVYITHEKPKPPTTVW